MLFCPTCGNMLLLRMGNHFRQQFYCQACPYVFDIDKQVDDVLGGSDAWKNVDSTDATCPKCEHHRAYYMQIQIRSADEPSSIFYKCCQCGHQWREG